MTRAIAMALLLGFAAGGVPSAAQAPVPAPPAPSVQFPGPNPGNATAAIEGETLTLRNAVLAARWSVAGQRLRWLGFESRIGGRGTAGPSEVFVLETSAGRIASSDCAVEPPAVRDLAPDPAGPRRADRLGGKSLAAVLRHDPSGVRVAWRAELRDGANALRSCVGVTAGAEPLTLQRVVLYDGAVPAAAVLGTVQGSPVAGAGLFLGFEHPLATNAVKDGRTACAHDSNRILAPRETWAASAVLGVYPEGQMRRGFLCYVEQERVRPYRPWLHYNTWYDIAWGSRNGGAFTEAEVLDAIHAFGRELVRKRGVKMDSFLLDDGWDDHNSVWEFHPGNWPRGLSEAAGAAARYDAHIGLWLSPWGGYSWKPDRLAAGRRLGMEIKSGSFSLSGPNYYRRFREQCLKVVDAWGVNGFKFDGIGAGNAGVGAGDKAADFDAAIRLFGDLRAARRDLYINLTTGTWPSPFWLLLADSVWRSEGDTGFHGAGPARQRWITYRDGVTYDRVVQAGPLYPINSLMTHGICYADHSPGGLSADADGGLKDEIRSYFASGTQLQELYISHRRMTPAHWDHLAESARWARDRADVLVDTHWVGGSPRRGQVYGWAAWTPRRAVLALRNPSDKPASISLDAAAVFELPEDAPRVWRLDSPYADQRVKTTGFAAGRPVTFELQPFEVLVFDAHLPADKPQAASPAGGGGCAFGLGCMLAQVCR